MKKHLILTCTCISLIQTLLAAPEFDRVFGSHMVIPRNKPIVFSGTATPELPVKVTFSEKTLTITPNEKGEWSASFPAQKANATPQSVTVTQDGESVSLNDILIGEVWLASGQSNMKWSLSSTPSGKTSIPAADNNQLRIFNNVPQVDAYPGVYTQKDFDNLKEDAYFQGTWQVSSPQSAAPCSAVAYYFARDLQKKLNIPVGIIHTSMGGSEMAAWLPPSEIEDTPEFAPLRGSDWLESKFVAPWAREAAKVNLNNKTDVNHPFKPAYLFKTGISWMVNFPITGVLWYQGETDAEVNDNELHFLILTRLIKSWRTAFRQETLPFVMIQLPRINGGRPYWPEFREVQALAATHIPNVLTINTIDLGSTDGDIHPPEKIEVGKRTADLIATSIYNLPIEGKFPTLKKWTIKGEKAFISFDNAKGLTTIDKKAPVGFEIAGQDGIFKPAIAEIEKNGIISLTSPDVKKPVNIRYCWSTFVSPNLVNKVGLPVFQFRTNPHKMDSSLIKSVQPNAE